MAQQQAGIASQCGSGRKEAEAESERKNTPPRHRQIMLNRRPHLKNILPVRMN
jgi:hypothetical protein